MRSGSMSPEQILAVKCEGGNAGKGSRMFQSIPGHVLDII